MGLKEARFLFSIFFRIARTLSPTKKIFQHLLSTQTNAICNFGALCLFAFFISSCAPTAVPLPTTGTIPPPTTLAATLEPARPTPTTQQALKFDGKHAYNEYLLGQMKFSNRPAGSKAIRLTGDYILSELQKSGWKTETQEFTFRGIPIRNVIAKAGAGQGPLIVVGAHYDTRPRANMDKQNPSAPVPGANDGASGVAVLLELARVLDTAKLKNEVWLAFFDAEDNGDLSACDLRVVEMQTSATGEPCDTTSWTWSIGTIHFVDNLQTKPTAVVILDMIGDADQNIYYEANSDKALNKTLWDIAAQLGYSQWFIPKVRWSMSDDHTPFLQHGIRAVDMIDFDYPPWHTTQDTADKVSADSLERVGRVVQTWLEGQ